MACVYMSWRTRAFWFSAQSLLYDIASCRGGRTVTRKWYGQEYELDDAGLLDLCCTCDLLCLDEIAMRSPSDVGVEVMHRIMEGRIGKPTMFTSNSGPDGIAKCFDGRIASRIGSGSLIKVTGPDRRMAGKKAKEVTN